MKTTTKLYLSIFITLLIGLSSCVTSKQTNLLQDLNKHYPQAGVQEEYRVIPGDLLTVHIHTIDDEMRYRYGRYIQYWRPEQIRESYWVGSNYGKELEGSWGTTPFTVYKDGCINFPYIGRVYVEGLTILEIRKILSDKLEALAEGTSAEVSLYNRYFSVLGETGSRRVEMPTTKMTIYQALAISNSITPSGDRSKVSILRQTSDGSIVKTFDLRSKDIVDSDFYYIQANDVIYVPQAKRKFMGSPTSFVALSGLLMSIASVVIFTIRAF